MTPNPSNNDEIREKRAQRQVERRFEFIAATIATRLAATILMMWGVLNVAFNFKHLNDYPDSGWVGYLVGAVLILLTGILPFVVGIVWLWRNVTATPRNPNS